MDPSESRPSPRRQLQGPRPTPLKVSKDSYKIKKPPVAPPPRAPIVIYAVSPTIIHAQPGEFMTLVQRLTGPSSSADVALPSPTGELSPAALIAAFERATPTHAGNRRRGPAGDRGVADAGPARFVPWALPPISPKLFSPSFDPSVFSILQELSPVFGGGSSSSGGKAFLISPSNSFLSIPIIPSPGACWDLLSQFPDLQRRRRKYTDEVLTDGLQPESFASDHTNNFSTWTSPHLGTRFPDHSRKENMTRNKHTLCMTK
ncbi:VQ motif [Musa troglodytarum]|uniref:VQ motif n=1 Tax=Musa troglodytarum TaxID=320322 RepID=A0A9E7I684_9LILI|nr:VQ motif [Musa troglodytarum]